MTEIASKRVNGCQPGMVQTAENGGVALLHEHHKPSTKFPIIRLYTFCSPQIPPSPKHTHFHEHTMAASRTASKALRGSFAKQLTSPQVQRRNIVSALNAAARPAVVKAAAKPFAVQQVRGVKTVDFAGHKETVYGM